MEVLLAICFIVTMFAGVVLIYLAMRQRSEGLDRQHRERMAMIERGHIPLTEGYPRSGGGGSTRALSLGIIVVGLGLALMTLIGVAAETPTVGIGVGGAIVIIGAAFIVRSLAVRSEAAAQPVQKPPANDA